VDEDEHLMLIDDCHVRDRSDLHLISHGGLLAQEEELRKSTLYIVSKIDSTNAGNGEPCISFAG
jgi:hypothetical protein